jgi:tRNA 2-selenouridine synthase
VLQGGYRAWRRHVTARLYDGELEHRFVLLDGQTGSAKTEILHRLAPRGAQTLDLEGLAEHRGSLFGAIPGRAQPSQKMFESRLLAALEALDPGRPVVAEAESSKIGERMIPPALWSRLAEAPRIELRADAAERARYLTRAYRDVIADRPYLETAFARLPVHPSRERIANWRALADAGEFETLVRAVMALHYDPAYLRARKKHDRPLLAVIDLAALNAPSQETAADRILAALDAVQAGREALRDN